MVRLSILLLGAIAMGSAVCGAFFLRFWRQGRDRFFLLFALSFFAQAANRVELAFAEKPSEANPLHYGVRLLAYLLIIVAVVDKNRMLAAPGTRSPDTRGNGSR
jgi:hypothetical protein